MHRSFACLALVLSGGVASAQTVALPLKGEDLPDNQRYRTFVHVAGIQARGKDIIGVRYLGNGRWSDMTPEYDAAPAGQAKQNHDFVGWNKPFYAMASGKIVGCWRRAPDNTPGSVHQWLTDKLIAGGGNHLWIRHDDGTMALYAHAIKDSIPPELCPKSKEKFDKPSAGAGKNPDIDPNVRLFKAIPVKKGQLLGRLGNSGASKGGPHLHVHLEKNGASVPMKLERGLYLELVSGKADVEAQWQSMSNANFPEKEQIFWPPRSVGTLGLTWNGIPAGQYRKYFDHFSNSGYMGDTFGCKQVNGTLTINSTWVPAKVPWYGWYGISPNDYATNKAKAEAEGFKQVAFYTCVTNAGPRHCAIFRKP